MSVKILLVDDERGILSSLNRLLRRCGYQTATFTDAREALQACKEVDFQVAISDYRMPIMTGTEFLIELRFASPNTVRLMLSGEADRDAVLSSINEAAIFQFLAKPWNDEDLLEIVEQAAMESRRLQEIEAALDSHRKQTDKDYRRQLALKALEEESPGITEVNWTEDGTLVIDDTN